MLTANVTVGKRFVDDESVDNSKLNRLGSPAVEIEGTAEPAQIGDGAVTEAKTNFGSADLAVGRLVTTAERRALVALAWAATVTLDFAMTVGGLRTLTLTGNVTFATANLLAGRDDVTVWVTADAMNRSLAWPADWIWVGEGAPTLLTAGMVGKLRLSSMGTTDGEVVAEWSVEPPVVVNPVVTVTYGASVEIDFAEAVNGMRTLTLAGNVLFTTTGLAAGREDVLMRVVGDGSERTLDFPGTWKWVGDFEPATLGASKTAVLRLSCWGNTDASVVAEWVVEPTPEDLYSVVTIGYAAAVVIDFSEAITAELQTVTLTGNLTVTTANLTAGRVLRLRIVGDGSIRNLVWPGLWKWLMAAPATLAANKVGELLLRSYGTGDANVVAEWSVEP